MESPRLSVLSVLSFLSVFIASSFSFCLTLGVRVESNAILFANCPQISALSRQTVREQFEDTKNKGDENRVLGL